MDEIEGYLPEKQGSSPTCHTCGAEVEPGAEACAACGLPLPVPLHLSSPTPWYVKALVVLGALWVAGVIWYTFNVELPEARRSQHVQDTRVEKMAPVGPAMPGR